MASELHENRYSHAHGGDLHFVGFPRNSLADVPGPSRINAMRLSTKNLKPTAVGFRARATPDGLNDCAHPTKKSGVARRAYSVVFQIRHIVFARRDLIRKNVVPLFGITAPFFVIARASRRRLFLPGAIDAF